MSDCLLQACRAKVSNTRQAVQPEGGWNGEHTVRSQSSSSQIVAVREATKPWHRYNPAPCIGIFLCLTTRRRFLRQCEMRSVVVVVKDVFLQQAFRCRSFRTITWLSRSRRQLPTQRSATPFCHGLRKLARLG